MIWGFSEVCVYGGFNLIKFMSNSCVVLEFVLLEKCFKEVRDFDFGIDCLFVECVFGV